jgi:hypothetical protein
MAENGTPRDERPGEGLDRTHLDRIIRRATELQFEGGGVGSDRLSEDEVLRIGSEVGLERKHLLRALGELRVDSLRAPAETDTGILHRVVGPARVSASRVVPAEATRAMHEVGEYLRLGESLRQVRKRGSRSRWEPEPGIAAYLQRELRLGGRSYDLARTDGVDVAVEPLGEATALVSITADVSTTRSQVGWGWGSGLTLGSAGVGLAVGLVIGIPFLVAPAVVAGGAGAVAAARRDYRKRIARIRQAMDGLLDRMEAGDPLLAPGPSLRDRWTASTPGPRRPRR